MKRTIALVLAVVMTVAMFAGCGSKPAASPSAAPAASGAPSGKVVSSKDTLVIGVANEPITLNPFDNAGELSARVKRLVMEGLYEKNDAGENIPLLAESWKWDTDTELTINLRKNVTFSDGIAFTAKDVMYTLKKYIESGIASIFQTYLDMDKSKIVDDHQVKLVLKEPTSLFFPMLESQHFGIVHQETYEADKSNFMYKPVGTGPYTLVEWKTGDSVKLVRNEKYWGDAAYCKNVTFRYIPESSQRTIELETGGIDINLDVAADDVDYFKSKDYAVKYYDTHTVPGVFFNMSDVRKSPVKNLKLRQAIAYAIDSKLIVDKFFKGVYKVANSNISPYYGKVYNAEGKEPLYAFNLDKAKALFKEANLTEGTKLTMLIDESPDNKGMAEIIQNMLKAIGIDMDIVTRNSTTWFATVCEKKEYDMVMFNLYDSNPVNSFMHFLDDGTFKMPDYTTWRNAKFEEALVKVSKIPELKDQFDLLREMDGYITADLPIYSIAYKTSIVAMKSSIQGFEYRLGMPNADKIYFK